jgi:putative Mg2+ transporter-C (MgtC) family protein
MTELELLIFLLPKIFAASICGLIVGWEREFHNKAAGIRTFILVCVGTMLFTTIPFILPESFRVDPTRVIAQIITGVGFLGGGVIFKQEDKVNGITSAAFIWLMSAIGVLVGLNYIMTGIILTFGLVTVLTIIYKLEK